MTKSSLLLAYFFLMNLPGPIERVLWTELTCWQWVIVGLVSTLILTPQFLVLVAVIRVCRFDPNLNSVQLTSNRFE